jgi:hypothetical protein
VGVEGEAPKLGMAAAIPTAPDNKSSLARIVDADGGRDEAENEYYEIAADPVNLQNERAQRRFRGSYLRRLRRLQTRRRDEHPSD